VLDSLSSVLQVLRLHGVPLRIFFLLGWSLLFAIENTDVFLDDVMSHAMVYVMCVVSLRENAETTAILLVC
jgi:hypothetical protein